jgi:hypothetical protein
MLIFIDLNAIMYHVSLGLECLHWNNRWMCRDYDHRLQRFLSIQVFVVFDFQRGHNAEVHEKAK